MIFKDLEVSIVLHVFTCIVRIKNDKKSITIGIKIECLKLYEIKRKVVTIIRTRIINNHFLIYKFCLL